MKNIDLEIKKGEFVCIIGEVGTGKSSLMHSLFGDMIHVQQNVAEEFRTTKLSKETKEEISMRIKSANIGIGQHTPILLSGSLSLAQQTPWIQNKTIRDNILFGEPLDEERYNKTLELCELTSDLEVLPGGDLTEIGEKGINLSGGQKARVSIARAVYAQRDIILLDDPLSALDSNVKTKVFENLLERHLAGTTRILVTHAVDFLDRVDRIIVMENGEAKHVGSFEEL